MSHAAPRGWKAALAAEQDLAAAARRLQGNTGVNLQAEAIEDEPRILNTVPSRLEEHALPWHPQQRQCSPGGTAAHAAILGDTQHTQQWLALLTLVAFLSFAAGWKAAKWRLMRSYPSDRSSSAMPLPTMPASDVKAKAATDEITLSYLNPSEKVRSHEPQTSMALDASLPAAPIPALNAIGATQQLAAVAVTVARTNAILCDEDIPIYPPGSEQLSSASSSAASARELSPQLSPHSLQSQKHSTTTVAGAIHATQGLQTPEIMAENHASFLSVKESSACACCSQAAWAQTEQGNTSVSADGHLRAEMQPQLQQQAAARSCTISGAELQHLEDGLTDKRPNLAVSAQSEAAPRPKSPPHSQILLSPQHSAEGEEAWRDAAQLVSTVAARLGVSIGDLGPGDRVQLIGVAVGAWQTFQQRDAHQVAAKQGAEANLLRNNHNRLVQSGLTDKQARYQAAEAVKGMAALQATLTDCIMTGLTLTVASLVYCGIRYGLLHVRIAACPAALPVAPVSMFRPWEALAPLQAVACWLFVIGDVLLGVLIVLGTAYVALKTRVLTGYHAMPLNRLVLGLGVACGSAGFIAVGKIGGDRSMWLLMWWAWIAVLVAALMNLQALYLLLRRPSQHNGAQALHIHVGTHTASGQSESGSSLGSGNGSVVSKQRRTAVSAAVAALAKPLAVVLVAVWWPLAMGCLPFDRSVAGELVVLLKRPGAAAVQRILF